MSTEHLRTYIANLPVGTMRLPLQREEDAITAVDINNLPIGIVTGSNLIQFSKDASSQIKSSVALCLLAAQRVAGNDPVVATPQQWIDRHNKVLTNLNWRIERGGKVESKFDNINLAVHEAIIPFLTAAFGGAVAAGALIITALKQLKEMDKTAPWITLFDRESRRFDVTEYQFSVVDVKNDQVELSLASARFGASYGRTQVLFFKITDKQATFSSASETLSTNTDLLETMNSGLKDKLAGFAESYIRSLPL